MQTMASDVEPSPITIIYDRAYNSQYERVGGGTKGGGAGRGGDVPPHVCDLR